MEQAAGRTGMKASVSFGLGDRRHRGPWTTRESMRALHAAVIDAGTNFIDTADVYGDGRSERLIGRGSRSGARTARPVVPTKIGRRAAHPDARGATRRENLRAWVERSRKNLGVETVDLLQLHCPHAGGLRPRPSSTTISTPSRTHGTPPRTG